MRILLEVMMNMLPIKMYEYMACEKPVIARKLPGIVKEFGERSSVVYVNKPEDNLEKAIVFLS